MTFFLDCFLNQGIAGALGWLKHLTLDFSSGHDLTVREFEPHIRLHADSTESA